MAEHSKIEWTTHTFNPWVGCQKVSPGCDHCYAEALMDTRYHKVTWGPHGERKRTSPANWRLPLKWAKQARASGLRPRVFCASLADWLDNQVPQQWRFDLWHLILDTPELDWLLLTKRIENFAALAPWPPWHMPPNVWLGVTAEDQGHYDKRWAILSQISAPVRFISYEPALGPIVDPVVGAQVPDWIIMGGESGKGARMMQPEWAQYMRSTCAFFNIPFFMKQMTGKAPIPDGLLIRQFPTPRFDESQKLAQG